MGVTRGLRPATLGPVRQGPPVRKLKPALLLLVLLPAVLTGIPRAIAQEGAEAAPVATNRDFLELVRRLDARDWVPPYFEGRVKIFNPVWAEQRIRAMEAEPWTEVKAGLYSYRTSRKRVAEGRRLFYLFDWGSGEYWRTNTRYEFFSLGVTRVEELEERFGILREPGGMLIGITGMPSRDGRIDYGWSCALCHAAPGPDGHPVAGAPNHRYNRGRIRYRALVAHDPRPGFATEDYVDRDIPLGHLQDLGAGRMDWNGDLEENPVKIPALWGLREIRAGIFANGSAGNIWFALGNHNGGVHPAGEFLEALVAYLLALEPPPNPRDRGEAEARGEAVFRGLRCESCHSGPYYTNGAVIPLEEIGTDGARVRREFPKGYKVPTLRRLDLQRIFLHDGSVASLEDLFRRGRLETAPGHEYGLDLSDKERADLVAFLLSL